MSNGNDNRFNNGMPPSNLEKENLEAHVELCHQRYRHLSMRLGNIEDKVDRVHKDIVEGNKSMSKTLITTAGTIMAGLLSTIVVVLIAFL